MRNMNLLNEDWRASRSVQTGGMTHVTFLDADAKVTKGEIFNNGEEVLSSLRLWDILPLNFQVSRSK